MSAPFWRLKTVAHSPRAGCLLVKKKYVQEERRYVHKIKQKECKGEVLNPEKFRGFPLFPLVMASMDFPGGSYNPHLQVSGVPLAKGSMYKSKDDMHTKKNRKNISIILDIPIWKKVAFARFHFCHDASFTIFPANLFRG